MFYIKSCKSKKFLSATQYAHVRNYWTAIAKGAIKYPTPGEAFKQAKSLNKTCRAKVVYIDDTGFEYNVTPSKA